MLFPQLRVVGMMRLTTIVIVLTICNIGSNTDVRIGLLLHEESLWAVANDSIVSKVASEQALRFITIYKPVMSNPINAALDLCEQLVTKQVSSELNLKFFLLLPPPPVWDYTITINTIILLNSRKKHVTK